MRSKTHQRLIREYEYEMNKPSYEDVEIDKNYFLLRLWNDW